MCGGGGCGRGHAWQGVCMAGRACVAGGMHGRGGVRGRGCAWQGACVAGGGACMMGGHVWQGGMCSRGVCMTGGHVYHAHSPNRYYSHGIWSMSGQYASSWNAFLFNFEIGKDIYLSPFYC